MTSAASVFVIQLARASRKANRFVRHLQRADREDVIAAAILWCWENKHNYSLTTTLDTWFVGAVRNAKQAWLRGEAREASEFMSEIPTGDTTLAHVEAQEAATKLILALPFEYKKVAKLQMQGFTREEMMAKGVSKDTIDNTRARIKQLRRLLPDDHEYRRTLRAYRAPSSDHPQGGEEDGVSNTHQSRIDREIEQLEAMPKHGKDCPPCWRCKWFEGYMPALHVSMRLPITEPEVALAVSKTEAEKVRIAREVRDGNL